MYSNIVKFVANFLSCGIPLIALIFILDLPLVLTSKSVLVEQYVALLWSMITALVFLTNKRYRDKWYGFALAAVVMMNGLYLAIWYPSFIYALGLIETQNIVLGLITIVLILESIRRQVGWTVVAVVLVFIFYAKFGNIFPGILETKPIQWSRLINLIYLGNNFFLGMPVQVVIRVVTPFILFGQVLLHTGGGDFLVTLSQSLAGKYRGGPAKVSILASAAFGSISGSAVANVASTGMITIPMMKSIGYRPYFAAAVESVASTGGAILPPVMGASAFVMAEFLGISYATVALSALVPALLYYFCLYLQVDLRALKRNLRGLSAEEIPSFWKTFSRGWLHLIPLATLVYTLFIMRLSTPLAAFYAILAILITVSLKKQTRSYLSWGNLFKVLKGTTENLLEIIPIAAGAGIVMGLVSYTGLSLSLSSFLVDIAGRNLFPLSLLIAGTSIILGMGLPAVAVYILLAILVGPALTELGINPIAGHLFLLYFGVISFITPPVCFASYAAAAIAQANPMKVGFHSVKLGLVGFIVPFVFLYNPALILIGSAMEIFWALIDCIIAVLLLAFGVEGYFMMKLRSSERMMFIAASILMFIPGLMTRALALAIALPLMLIIILRSRKIDGLVKSP